MLCLCLERCPPANICGVYALFLPSFPPSHPPLMEPLCQLKLYPLTVWVCVYLSGCCCCARAGRPNCIRGSFTTGCIMKVCTTVVYANCCDSVGELGSCCIMLYKHLYYRRGRRPVICVTFAHVDCLLHSMALYLSKYVLGVVTPLPITFLPGSLGDLYGSQNYTATTYIHTIQRGIL